MKPLDRFPLDHIRITFLYDDKTTEEVFFLEEARKVSKTNVFSINSNKYECSLIYATKLFKCIITGAGVTNLSYISKINAWLKRQNLIYTLMPRVMPLLKKVEKIDD